MSITININEEYNAIFGNLKKQHIENKTIGQRLTKSEYDYYEQGLVALNNLIENILKSEGIYSVNFDRYFDCLKGYLLYIEESNDDCEYQFLLNMLGLTEKVTDNKNEKYNFETIACILYEKFYNL